MAAGFYSWFISNQAATDDFGRGRLAPASLWAKVFEKRIDRGMTDVTPQLVAVWFGEWERVGLVRLYLWGGEAWFEWVNFQGVPPTKQRYHRAPEPPWGSHECSHRCQRSAKKFSKLLKSESCTTAAVLGSRTATALGTYSVFRSPSSSVPLSSSVPPLPLQTDTTAPRGALEGALGPDGDLFPGPPTEPDPRPPVDPGGKTRRPHRKHRNPDDPWPTGEAIADYEACNGAGSAPGGEIAGQLDVLVRAQADVHGTTAAGAWEQIVRPRWRAYWGLEVGPHPRADHPSPSAADFRKHFAGRRQATNGNGGKDHLREAWEGLEREFATDARPEGGLQPAPEITSGRPALPGVE